MISSRAAHSPASTQPASGWAVQSGSRRRILGPESDPSVGDNLNGATVIRVPDWVANPLGKYYLYFGHHRGQSIRLAYADHPEGLWTVHPPGCLNLTDVPQLYDHMASPEIVIDENNRQIRMYVHGGGGMIWWQETALSLSRDGLHFEAQPGVVAPFYLRVFRRGEEWFGIARDGVHCSLLLTSPDGLQPFRRTRDIFPNGRHYGLLVQGDVLWVFYSKIGDSPERILVTRVEMKGSSNEWEFPDGIDLLRPEFDWEGIGFPLKPSRLGPGINIRQLRDPFVFEEDGKFYLYYSAAGESCLGMARLEPKNG